MTKDEAVKKIAREGYISIEHAEELYDSIIPKPTVPQYVVDWYEWVNYDFYGNLECRAWDKFELLAENNNCVPEKPLADDFTRWYYNTKNAVQILVNMHQFGYEVEGEKRYTVRIRNLDDEETYLNYDNFRETWVFYSREDTDRFRTTHTKKQLEDGCFGWVFDCEGIEVKEV